MLCPFAYLHVRKIAVNIIGWVNLFGCSYALCKVYMMLVVA